ncbi:hypothetical protein LTR08_008353 [Meristemomyces frigidus]|nr:hypothetical protein LTR08_008353 [Meristemomyces frigidus]
MDSLVRTFNDLPRPEETIGGLPNHFVFVVRHVPLNPPGDLLIGVHIQSYYLIQAGPAQILTSSDKAVRAERAVPLLLEAFIEAQKDPATGRPPAGIEAVAPWTWATDDADFAKEIEVQLKKRGVIDDLCSVGVCTAKEKHVVREAWSRFLGLLFKRTAVTLDGVSAVDAALEELTVGGGVGEQLCHNCFEDRMALPAPLKKCGACGKAWYCSTECQRGHWKLHKNACKRAIRTDSSPPPSAGASKADAHTYYNNLAHILPEAAALASALNLTLPKGNGSMEGTMKPLRRLIITGKDNPANIKLLFGPQWAQTLQSTYDETRVEVLLDPPQGSPSYAMTHRSGWDTDAPVRLPRPARETEQRKVDEVKAMQTRVRQRMGSRKEPNNADMMAVLDAFGAQWSDILPVYNLAMNTMDQGVWPL